MSEVVKQPACAICGFKRTDGDLHDNAYDCVNELQKQNDTLRELVRAAYYEGAMASGPGASEREWLCSEACKELGA